MSYSCTIKASMVLHTFRGEGECSNTWQHRGQEYFWERGRENRDGAITGSIWSMTGRKVGTFRIGPEGTIERAGYGLRDRLNFAEGLRNYIKAYEPATAWVLACQHDGIDPAEKFVVFSEENPYA